MTVTFFSNFLLHHQTPFCEAMVRQIGDGFRFVATEKIPPDRLAMGYKDLSHSASYAVNSYESGASYNEALRLGRESDVVIIGSAPDEFIVDRLKENRLTFRYYERFFKEGKWHILDPRVAIAHYKQDFRYRNKNLYMLCASAYTAPDCRFIFSYPGKTFKWGYFPETRKYDDIERLIELKHPASILWVGRLIGWKHPEAAVLLAEQLKKDGYKFNLTILGEGEREEMLRRMIEKKNLSDCVKMHGFVPSDEVRQYMEKADIYLFTSDRNEGWGAVLNESMNSACAVVACREIGSVPYLIEHGKNGLIYDRKGPNSLYANVKRLLDDEKLKKELQKGAYQTMTSLWNADTAAGRLLCLIECIQNKKEPEYTYGPCSRA